MQKKIFILVLNACFIISTIVFPFEKVHASTVQSSITRSEAEQRALNMINLTWTYSNYKNGNAPSQYVTSPKQFNNVTTANVTGIPYNWGGFDGLNSSSYNTPWTNFLDAVNNNAYTGNVNTDSGYGYIPGTAGLDCSGFVQAVFNINDYKLSTSTLFSKYFTEISINDIKHMDILDKPGDHVVVFDKWGTLNGIYGAFTYESTTDQTYGGIQGTKKYFMSMKELNKGYIPGRYVNLIEHNNPTPVPRPVDPGIFAKITNVTNYANFRSTPSLNSSIIGTLPKDTILYLIDYSNGWYKVYYNGKIGWVYGTLITSIPSGKYVTIKNAYQLNIRSNPSTTGSIVGILNQNEYAEVIDYSINGTWFKIRINGIEGYSSSKYLSYIY